MYGGLNSPCLTLLITGEYGVYQQLSTVLGEMQGVSHRWRDMLASGCRTGSRRPGISLDRRQYRLVSSWTETLWGHLRWRYRVLGMAELMAVQGGFILEA